jgi:hypothetical protein
VVRIHLLRDGEVQLDAPIALIDVKPGMGAWVDMESPTAEELALLDAWRRLPPERRRVMLELLDWCATAPLSARYVAER